MGIGYTRNDGPNNIANGNVIDADDLDGEFDAIVDAFASATGHTHDGTSAEGGAITVVGPAQEFIADGTSWSPKTDATYDLGKAAASFNVAYVETLNLGGTAITATAAEINYTDGVTSAIQPQLDNKQPLDAGLTSISGLTTLADRMIYTTASDTYAVATLTSAGRSLIDDASASDQRTTLGLGTAATTASTAYATAAQGTTADAALPKAGGTMTGNITMPALGTVDGRDLSVDGAKLDGIEAGANVTDTANVTAAGALMDSEVDADIKTLSLPANTTISTFGASLVNDASASAARTTLGLGTAATTASTAYATSTQGTTADNALPKAGGAMTGAITTNSTFDGRDVATDGTKLDTIENSADVTDTTNVTAAGALMDSEVTNLAQVKAFASSDYATAAQGTTADSALQPNGDGSGLTGIEGVPSGVITMWSGAISAIPSGWVICDGANSTPNLTDRFVIHADADAAGTRNVGASGGAHNTTIGNANIPSHSHSVGNISAANSGNHTHGAGNYDAVSAGNHSHGAGNYSTSNTGNHSHGAGNYVTSNQGNHTHTSGAVGPTLYSTSNTSTLRGSLAANGNTGAAGSHSHNVTGNSSNTGAHSHNVTGNSSNTGAHTHNVSGNSSGGGDHSHTMSGNTGNSGSGTAISTIPAFYALAYIMKS